MRKLVHSEVDNLDWRVRLVWLPEAIRPIGLRQIYEGSVGTGRIAAAGPGVLLSPIIFLVLAAPVMAVVLPLRFAGLLSWEIEAITRPWGKLGPATVMRWRVKGWSEAGRVVDEVAAALAAGNKQPRIAGAERET